MQVQMLLALAGVLAMIALIVFVGRTPTQPRRPLTDGQPDTRSARPDVRQYRHYKPPTK